MTLMKLDDLFGKSILILGFGAEGQATYRFLRRTWPSKPLSIADQRAIEEFPERLVRRLRADPAVSLKFGPSYMDAFVPNDCQVIIKTPGIPASTRPLVQARTSGCILTSHSQVFLSNYPREKVIGITGTKGKSTTASLIYHVLKTAGLPAELVGNIGQPPLARLAASSGGSYFVHEFSSHQLAEVQSSPHIAVLLNIVPEHLDYYSSFAEYVAAKENITRFQDPDDFLIFNMDYPIPRQIAERNRASRVPFSTSPRAGPGCSLRGETLVWSGRQGEEEVIKVADIPLRGRFNVQNVLAAVAAAALCGVEPETIRQAVQRFQALPHRLELVGTFNGVTFYDDSIATVPEATLAALEVLGPDVQTLLLGGHERNLDFSGFGARLPANIRTVILFPESGQRIWKAIEAYSNNPMLPEPFFVEDMDEAVKIAYSRTEPGKVCLLSPAASSFGLFKDYRERGECYRASIRKIS